VRRSGAKPRRAAVEAPYLKPYIAALAIPLAVLTFACDSDGGPDSNTTEVPGGADPAAVEVIDEWATELTEGDIDAAAARFAIPSVAANGVVIEIRDLDDARLFNASLPCGAELVAARPEGEFVIATFRLSERPGPGTCGSGVGETARTAFAIDAEGKITEWRRVLPGATEPESLKPPSTSI
jgi:hypothetical protein